MVATTTGTAPRTVARHTAAAEELAAEGRWEEAYEHLRSAMRMLGGRPAPADELDRLRREHAEAREQSRRDSLTATYNRRYLDERLLALLDAPVRAGALGLSVAIVDADHFKAVNDTYGHPFGDRVLQRLVTLLDADLPDGAFCARYGGEEFALVLPDRDLATSVRICEAARDRVDRHPWAELDPSLRVTVSAGVAHSAGQPPEVEQVVGAADMLLYAAKSAGRNAVAFRDLRSGLVRLAGPAARRRTIPQPPAPQAQVSRAQVSRAQVSRAQVSRAQVSRAQVSRAQVSRAQVSRAQVSQSRVSQSRVSQAQSSQLRVSQSRRTTG